MNEAALILMNALHTGLTVTSQLSSDVYVVTMEDGSRHTVGHGVTYLTAIQRAWLPWESAGI